MKRLGLEGHRPEHGKSKEEFVDYRVYRMNAKQWAVSFAAAAGCLSAIGMVFYSSVWIAGFLGAAGIFYPRVRRQALILRRQKQLAEQFKHALQALSSALGAGKSLESAFVETIADLRLLYPDPRTFIVKEFEVINFQVENRIPIEKAFARFSDRSGVEDIEQFGEMISTCKRSGGDLKLRHSPDIRPDR